MERRAGFKAAIASIGDSIAEAAATEAASTEATSTEATSNEAASNEAASIASTKVAASSFAATGTSHNCSLEGATFVAPDKGRTISLCLRLPEGRAKIVLRSHKTSSSSFASNSVLCSSLPAAD